MAKGNIILGQMRGSIGDIVFWRGNGEQLSRSRNRKPANPRTDSQLSTRIILKTCSTAYSKLMFDYANQTFQGAKIGAENQRKFMSANTKILRDYIKQGADDMNFNGKDDTVAMLNRYRVSEGNLPSINATVSNPAAGSSAITLGTEFTVAGATPTYQEICDAFGLAPGTQLTFLLCNIKQGTIQYVVRKRIILSPASGDMSVAFISNGAINDPNPSNDAQGLIPDYSANKLNFEAFGDFLAVAVAASYYDGTKWQYSTEQIWYSPLAGLGVHTLAQAIASWQVAIAGSEEYTRQANTPDSGGDSPANTIEVVLTPYTSGGEELEPIIKTARVGEYVRLVPPEMPEGAVSAMVSARYNDPDFDASKAGYTVSIDTDVTFDKDSTGVTIDCNANGQADDGFDLFVTYSGFTLFGVSISRY